LITLSAVVTSRYLSSALKLIFTITRTLPDCQIKS